MDIDDKSVTGNAISEYDPGFGWTYAVVHIGEGAGGDTLFAYWDEPDRSVIPPGEDNILNVLRTFVRGVSFIRFYGPHDVPEPATMLLLGTGLIGLAVFGRKRFKT